MKALSVKPLWATAILMEERRVEQRTWSTDYRGPLLVCVSSGPWLAGSIRSHALRVVDLLDVVPFEERHLEDALMDEVPERPGYAWLLGEPSFVVPFEVKGRLHLFDVDDGLVRYMEDVGVRSFIEFAERHYRPLVRWGDREMPREAVEEGWADWMRYLAGVDAGEGELR